jgi:hypothetical protein
MTNLETLVSAALDAEFSASPAPAPAPCALFTCEPMTLGELETLIGDLLDEEFGCA